MKKHILLALFCISLLPVFQAQADSTSLLCTTVSGKLIVRNNRCSRGETRLDIPTLQKLAAANIIGAVGEQGPKGDTGAQGIQGLTGETGAVGPKGDKGDQGLQGIKGDAGIQGEKGATGASGPKGDKGDKGDTGAQGPAPTYLGWKDLGELATYDNSVGNLRPDLCDYRLRLDDRYINSPILVTRFYFPLSLVGMGVGANGLTFVADLTLRDPKLSLTAAPDALFSPSLICGGSSAACKAAYSNSSEDAKYFMYVYRSQFGIQVSLEPTGTVAAGQQPYQPFSLSPNSFHVEENCFSVKP